jgi:acetyl esterase
MIDGYSEEYNKALETALNNARLIRAANSMVKVSGQRVILPLAGREIEIVYYSAPSQNAPLIIGFHGGGFLYGGCALDDTLWPEITRRLNVNVAAIGYRQSPSNTWRDSLADSYESALYLASHPDDFGFDPEHISVMGQSAGGNLALCVSLMAARDQSLHLDNQILVYPLLDLYTDPADKGWGSFSGIRTRVMNDLHCAEPDRKNPFASPFYATDEMLTGLPNTIMVFSENDNLTKEGRIFEERLHLAGINVSEIFNPGMPHGFLECGFKKRVSYIEKEFLGENCDESINKGVFKEAAINTINFIKKEFIR